jgi:Reverse transcriptase (RNA-dependent DNA polymerase)/Group II intron, maturase-specific domain
VQAAVKIVIEPIFEADFQPSSFGFWPRRAAHDVLQVLIDECWRRRWVVETDIASCFEEIPHDRLMRAIEERICDRKLLQLLGAMLRSGVMEEGAVRRSDTGTPQGGVRLLVPVEQIVRDVNRFLRGWAGYFRHGNSARRFHLVRTYATDRLALLVAKRHRRARSYGWRAIVHRSPDRYGLINLNGSIVAPRPNRPWWEKPNAGGEGRR